MKIRIYQDSDFNVLCRLCHGVTEYYRIGEIPTEAKTVEYVRNRVLGNDSDIRIAMAIENTDAIGFATFSIMYPSANLKGQLYLKELYVDDNHRGKGAGRALMKFIARYALDHNCNRMDWSAEKTNPGALEFYRAIGARPLDYKVYYRMAEDELDSFANGD